MELADLLKRMEACNPEATLAISTNCSHEVTLTWYFMGISHKINHLKIHQIDGHSIPFQRTEHMARCVMRCRMNLRKLYQKCPKMHQQVMSGALK